MIRAVVVALVLLAVSPQTPPGWQTYTDPQKRFTFDYPPAFGAPDRGTDDGFQTRAAAVRFSGLSGLGGEAVVTSGTITVDVQALGGLYDSFARGVFPDADLAIVLKALPAAAASNFCALLGAADHLAGQTLPPRLDAAARQIDQVRNLQPVVHRCDLTGEVVVFHKEATFAAGAFAARQHIYGVVRFLPAPFSSFQIVRGATTPPAGAELETLAQVAGTFRTP